MNQNEQLIQTFYEAFQQRDASAMAACYGPTIRFSDPVFRDLDKPEVTAMWRMLCDQGSDLEIVFSNVIADDRNGSAHWEPTYSFGASGRNVHNKIDASFEFEGGRIVRHIDDFDLWRWSRMALGLTGVLAGWSRPAQSKIRQSADRSLRRFIDQNPG